MSFIVDAIPGGATYRFAGPAQDPLAPTVLTIDPGLRVGWAFARLNPRRLLAGGDFELDRTALYISAWRRTVALLEEFSPTQVVMEQYFVAPGAHCGRSIEARGAMKAAVERHGVAWTELNPARVRAGLGVKGKLSDAQIRAIICDLFQMPAKHRPDPRCKREMFFPADVFDAAALAWAVEQFKGGVCG